MKPKMSANMATGILRSLGCNPIRIEYPRTAIVHYGEKDHPIFGVIVVISEPVNIFELSKKLHDFSDKNHLLKIYSSSFIKVETETKIWFDAEFPEI